MNLNPLVDISANKSSFPSTHTGLAFCLAFGIYFIKRKAGIIFFIFSLFIALARIFVGVHWPSDIIFGILLGFLVFLIVKKSLAKFYGRTHQTTYY